MKSVPNTGAMVTCAGLALLHKLNMAQGALIPTSQSIVAANNKTLHILGAVMLEIRAEKEGNVKFTRQFCYICKDVTGKMLSQTQASGLKTPISNTVLPNGVYMSSILMSKYTITIPA